MTTFYVALAGTAGTAALVAHLNASSPIKHPPIEPPAKPYELCVAASGIVEAMSENVSIGVPEAGLIETVHVAVWDEVREGQPLFTLDGRELRAEIAVREAEVLVAEATLRRIQDQLSRLKGVTDPRAVSAEEVRTKEHDVQVAAAQVKSAQAQLEQRRVRLARLTVAAPRPGTILQVNVRSGEFASATPKSPAMVLGDLEHLQVRADVDEQNATRLQPGMTATAFLKGVTTDPIALDFVRIEPYVVPKVSLTGASTERVDTRVLQVIYSFRRPADRAVYVGQQVDLFVKSDHESVTEGDSPVKQLARTEVVR
ncbi:MAG: efflux RND transporter periplasmic adaptor subunit [Verrucomicrobiales bacterium]|nr:efflux RND transporter periplasmic adaptor subunit [Verrucomicrobiales bacterium]